MEDKYYTPKIEEFHIGFECEVFGTSYQYPVTLVSANIIKVLGEPVMVQDWDKVVCEWDDLELVYDDWEHEYDNFKNEYRVKYLDREDIESFGFVFDQTTKDGSDYYMGGGGH